MVTATFDYHWGRQTLLRANKKPVPRLVTPSPWYLGVRKGGTKVQTYRGFPIYFDATLAFQMLDGNCNLMGRFP